MKKILDVGLQRKLKKKNLIKKYLKVVALFISFFLAMFLIWHISLKSVFFGKHSDNFPILFSGDNVLGFEKTNSGFCILTNNNINLYNKNGVITKNFVNNSSKTIIKSCGSNILVYEKHSKNFSIQNEKRLKFSGGLDQNIIFGKIFKNGDFAFVTSSDKCFCELVVFNKKNEQIFHWSCAESLIVDFCILDDSSGCVVATVGVNKGFSKGSIYELKFSNEKEKLKKDFNKLVPLAIKKSGSSIILVCDSKILYINEKGKVLKICPHFSELKNYVVTDDGCFIGCFNVIENYKFSSVLICYDRYGNKVAQNTIDDSVRMIKSFDGDVVIVTDSGFILTNEKLKNFKKLENYDNIEDFIYLKPYIYFVSMNKINRVNVKFKE